jgi:hypothetical protein
MITFLFFRYNPYMGRGKNNILFHPPLIKKTKKIKGLSSPFSEEIAEASFVGNQVFFRAQSGMICYLEDSSTSNNSWSWVTDTMIPKEALFSASENAIAWIKEDKIIKRDQELFAEKDTFSIDLPKEGAKPLSLYLSNHSLYLLWQDRESEGTFLSRTSLEGWKEVKGFDSDQVEMVQKGSRALLLENNNSSRATFRSLTLLDLESKGDIPLGNIKLPIEITKNWEKLITAEGDGSYWFLSPQKGSADKKSLMHSKRGTANINTVADLKKENYLELQSDGENVALLSDRYLRVFSKDGLIKEIPLSKKYKELAFREDGAIIWNKGEKEYLYLNL